MESREVEEPEPFRIRERVHNEEQILRQRHRQRNETRARSKSPPRPVFRIGGSVIPAEETGELKTNTNEQPNRPSPNNGRRLSQSDSITENVTYSPDEASETKSANPETGNKPTSALAEKDGNIEL